MKFSKPLLLCTVLFLLVGCVSVPEKDADKIAAEKSSSNIKAKADDATTPVNQSVKESAPTSVLPAGPVTPNPYLQNPQKFSEPIEVNFHDAVAAMQQQNWAHAEAVLLPLADKTPNLSGVHLNLGIVYRAKGETEKASTEFNRAISANPKNVDAYNQLAVLKREAGDFSAAETLYQKALTIWPFYPEGHKNIAILYELYLAKPEQALPHYLAYQQLLPAPDKQVDSWVADLERRLKGGKDANKAADTKTPDQTSEKAEAK